MCKMRLGPFLMYFFLVSRGMLLPFIHGIREQHEWGCSKRSD